MHKIKEKLHYYGNKIINFNEGSGIKYYKSFLL